MRKTLIICFFIFIFIQSGQAQDKDSLSIRPNSINFKSESQLNFALFELKILLELNGNKSSSKSLNNLGYDRIFGNDSFNKNDLPFDDITLPLSIKYQNSQKNLGLTYMLGLVQGAAAGYLAYQHIKKFGFLKKKDD